MFIYDETVNKGDASIALSLLRSQRPEPTPGLEVGSNPGRQRTTVCTHSRLYKHTLKVFLHVDPFKRTELRSF